MAIETLVFDLGKVLVDFDFDRGMDRFARRCALSRDHLATVIRNEEWLQRYECGEIGSAEYLEYLRNNGGLQMDLAEFHESWSSVFLPDLLVPEEFLGHLRRSYSLVLLSNTNESHAHYIGRNYRVFDYFDHKIFSYEVGAMKPDPKIYEAAIAVSGKNPEALFFTDDREENVEAARKLGIQAHQFASASGLVQALRAHGVDTGSFS